MVYIMSIMYIFYWCFSYGGLVARGSDHSAGMVYITRQGLQMVSVYCVISGLAGVYSEWVLKDKYQVSCLLRDIRPSWGLLRVGPQR